MKTKRTGITLIELLVVATLVLMLMTISVPAIKPMLQSQATSNAASTVSTYLNRARARAMRTGRPCGVRFERWPNTAGASLVLKQVEVPPLFSGFDENDHAILSDTLGVVYTLPYSRDLLENLLPAGSKIKIRFDYSGPFYPAIITYAPAATVTLDLSTQTYVPPRKSEVPFEIMLPYKTTMTAPIGLPQGTVVDLQFSGFDGYDPVLSRARSFFDTVLNAAPPTTITFLPSGEVDRVTGIGNEIPSDTIYFLIGRWEKISELCLADETLNYADGNNFWVTINPRTGIVSTTEVNATIVPPVTGNDQQILANMLIQSREFARNLKRNLGGH